MRPSPERPCRCKHKVAVFSLLLCNKQAFGGRTGWNRDLRVKVFRFCTGNQAQGLGARGVQG